MQSKQPLLMDIPAEPCPQSSSHTDCDVLQQLQDSATKDNFLENSQGSQDNISQPPDTPETETRSSDTLPLSNISTSKILTENGGTDVCCDQTLSLLRCKPQDINKKNGRPPQPLKTAGQALPPPHVRALRPLPQCQGPNPPQWYVSDPCYIGSNIHKCLLSKREPSVPVASSISVWSRDRKSKAFSSRTADPSNLPPVMHQSKIAVETKCNTIKLAFLNIFSLKNKSFLINDLITWCNTTPAEGALDWVLTVSSSSAVTSCLAAILTWPPHCILAKYCQFNLPLPSVLYHCLVLLFLLTSLLDCTFACLDCLLVYRPHRLPCWHGVWICGNV